VQIVDGTQVRGGWYFGDDLIVGGAGNDTMFGGGGSDTYWFGKDDGRDVISEAQGFFSIAGEDATDMDVVRFAPGIAQTDVTFHADSSRPQDLSSRSRERRTALSYRGN